MNVLRWLMFWPVSIAVALLASGIVLFLGGLILGQWWLTGCLVIAVGTAILPIAASLMATVIAPRINCITAYSVLLPCAPFYLASLFTIFGLIFLGYEGEAIDSELFTGVSPWWCSLSICLGWIYGYSIAGHFWDECFMQQQLIDQYVQTQQLDASSSLLGGAAEAA